MGGNPSSTALTDKTMSINSKRGSWSDVFRTVDNTIVKLMMPVYFDSSPIHDDEVNLCKENWNALSVNDNPLFLKMKSQLSYEEFPFQSSKAWFLKLYFGRLFDIHPLSAPMFADPWSQERFVVGLQAFMFSVLSDKDNYRRKLISLAVSHCAKGVKAVEYGIIGEVWFWALEQILGETYTEGSHTAWRKLFSSMLIVIVPVAITHELRTKGEAQKGRSSLEVSSYSWKNAFSYKKESDQRYLQAQKIDIQVIESIKQELDNEVLKSNDFQAYMDKLIEDSRQHEDNDENLNPS